MGQKTKKNEILKKRPRDIHQMYLYAKNRFSMSKNDADMQRKQILRKQRKKLQKTEKSKNCHKMAKK